MVTEGGAEEVDEAGSEETVQLYSVDDLLGDSDTDLY